MKFLCLHGYGTNSAILEATFAPIRAQLPADWEFQFLDGLVEVPPTLGVDAIYPGPYVCYHGEPTFDDLQAVYELVMEVVEEDGPFDGVLGFSQGSALAASIMLHEAKKKSLPQPFRMGVFLSTTMPFDFGSGILRLEYTSEHGLKATHLDDSLNPIEKDTHIDWLQDCRTKTVIEEFEARRPHSMSVKEVDVRADVLLRYNPSTHTQRLHLPTVHVIGTNDTYANHGKVLFGMCDERWATLVSHDGGHQLPRDSKIVGKVASAIMKAIEQI